MWLHTCLLWNRFHWVPQILSPLKWLWAYTWNILSKPSYNLSVLRFLSTRSNSIKQLKLHSYSIFGNFHWAWHFHGQDQTDFLVWELQKAAHMMFNFVHIPAFKTLCANRLKLKAKWMNYIDPYSKIFCFLKKAVGRYMTYRYMTFATSVLAEQAALSKVANCFFLFFFLILPKV